MGSGLSGIVLVTFVRMGWLDVVVLDSAWWLAW